MKKTTLYWLTNDLRLEDNATLVHAGKECDRLVMVYCVDPAWFRPNEFGLRGISHCRWQFLLQALQDMNASLEALGQKLLICYGHPVESLAKLAEQYQVQAVYRSHNCGFNENLYWASLKQRVSHAEFREFSTYTLYDRDQIDFSLELMPPTFQEFHRKVLPGVPIKHAVAPPGALPPPPADLDYRVPDMPDVIEQQKMPFMGGESQGLAQLADYFSSPYPAQHKQLSANLDGWNNSSKLSPWLALGNISARKFVEELEHYQRTHAENDSTEQLFEEMIWREYFQWYALANGERLFELSGVAGSGANGRFDQSVFDNWCQGTTQFPLVNACMRHLNSTGFLSAAGRQIAASCFIHELDLDWRYGAAYFEQQLVDHDVALNWGNWQYMAGVGSDPKAAVHLDLQEQTRLHDPDGEFVRRWGSDQYCPSLGVADYADWPVE